MLFKNKIGLLNILHLKDWLYERARERQRDRERDRERETERNQ